MRMFFAHSAALNYTITMAGTSNAFQQSPPTPKDDSLPLVPTGSMDAAHATDMIQCRSVTRLLFMPAGGVIAYKSKLQVSVATTYKSKHQVSVKTSTELYTVEDGAKIGTYL